MEDPQQTLSDAFREAFRTHPAGVAVITTASTAGPVGLTVSSLISVSADPALVAFSLSSRSSSSAPILQAKSIVIHLIRYEDIEIARLGATSGIDRFAKDVEWETLPTGEPRYTSVKTWFRAEITSKLELEGATLIVAKLLEGHAPASSDTPETNSLIYLDRRWHRLSETA